MLEFWGGVGKVAVVVVTGERVRSDDELGKRMRGVRGGERSVCGVMLVGWCREVVVTEECRDAGGGYRELGERECGVGGDDGGMLCSGGGNRGV